MSFEFHAAEERISRRAFVKRGALLLPLLLPSRVWSAVTKPSNRFAMGMIGVGGMGTGNLRGFLAQDDAQVVAVCDVDRRRSAKAKQLVDERYRNKSCHTYRDFRELIAHEKLDAVCLSLPEHWHALAAVTCARAGLDIYGEKPLARSIREGRAIVETVRQYGNVWQTGSQQRSDRTFRHACELVRNGRIGKVSRVEVGLPHRPRTWPEEPATAAPAEVDWNLWLGPAPWRPFCKFGKEAPHYDWRFIRDFSGGALTDWAGHHVDIAHWGLGLEETGPVTVTGHGEYPSSGIYDVPGVFTIDCTYATGVVINISSENPMGTKWYGEHGWIHVTRGSWQAEPVSLLREQIEPTETRLYVSTDHRKNFLDCVRTRRPTVAPAEVGHRSITPALLGEIAMLTGRKIRWDASTEEIHDDAGASALLERAYREPWRL